MIIFNEQIEIKSNLSNFKQLSARLLDEEIMTFEYFINRVDEVLF
ncbi:hypothetical protein HMPREF1112_0184 [Streptococcus pseudopneumoniae SK674]|nr:hypothetical protein HMPREF1112_0184 [Streptococcus pseudopneumoniae SK674]